MSKPRRLTPDEINDIVEALPKTLAATRKCAEFMRKQIQDSLRLQLSDKSIKIIPEGIPKLKEYIRMQHFNSLVPAGEPVGIRAAEAIGQPITQMSLNAFHSAGSSASVGSGIDAMKEIFNVSQKRKNENMFIHFKNKYLSFEEIIDLRRKIVGVTIQDLIIKMELEPNVESKKSGWWYDLYKDLFSKKIPKCKTFLRVSFDKGKLYAYDLTLSDIASKIDGQHITCIPSSSYEGIIDFYPNDDYNMENLSKKNSELDITEDNVSTLFIQMSFIPNLKEEIVNGIRGVSQIFTDKPYQVSSLIFNENHIEGKKWSFIINEHMRIVKGVPIEKFEKLLQICKIKILDKKKSYYEVELPSEAYADHTIEALEKQGNEFYEKNNPITYIAKTVKADDTIRIAKTKEEKKEGIYKPQEVSELSRAAYYYTATSNGINLVELLAHELVDTENTLSNNPHEVLKALGIEAARNFLINEYIKIISADGSYINPRHVMISADFQTSLGSLSQITARGAARQQVGPLSLASYEMAMDTLLEAAAFGKYEEANSTSSSIYLGKRMVLGTGIFKMKLDTKALEQAESEKVKRSSIIKKDKRLDSKAQQVMFQELDMEGDLFNPVEDMNVDLDDILKPSTVIERLKIKSEIPETKSTNIEIPSALKILLRKEYKGESKKILASPSSPIRASSPKKQTLSEQGLPAIPDFSPQQILSAKPKKKNKIDLDAFLNE
jgi:DNA-directed RNA polymerase beta' subunit